MVSHHHQGIAQLAEGFEAWAVARWAGGRHPVDGYGLGVLSRRSAVSPGAVPEGPALTDGLGVGLLQAAGMDE